MILASIVSSLIISLAVCFLFFVFWRRRVRRELETDALAGKLRREINALITDLNGTTERNVALMENTIRKADAIVEKAEHAIAQLKSETEKRDLSQDVYTSLGRSRSYETVIDWKRPESSGRELPAMEENSAVSSLANDETIAPPDFSAMSNRDKVLVQYRRGESSDAIASSLGMSRGEVELIISLHDRRR